MTLNYSGASRDVAAVADYERAGLQICSCPRHTASTRFQLGFIAAHRAA